MERIEQACWVYYLKDRNIKFNKEKVGKWMYFFDFSNMEYVEKICKTAVENNIVLETKYQCLKREMDKSGLVCFYLEFDDVETHKKVINYMIDNNLIKKTKTGKYHNISFKLDVQTIARQYGSDFKSDIKLSNFIDLETGDWIYKE